MKGDAGEYIHLLKRSLLAEVNAQYGEDEDYNNNLIKIYHKVLGHVQLWFNRGKYSLLCVQKCNQTTDSFLGTHSVF